MKPIPSERRRIMQCAWVVEDIRTAAMNWVETMGVGPFFHFPHLQLDVNYRGEPSQIDFSVASAQAGDVQIELIEQHSDDASAYRDLIGQGERGHHHLAIYVEDYDAAVAHFTDRGFVAATDGLFGAMRFAYFDTSVPLGCMIEVIEHDPIQDQIFARIRDAAENWDGSDPIRSGMPETSGEA